jgi:hypothetical protein
MIRKRLDLRTKHPIDIVLWVANIKKVRLDKDHCVRGRQVDKQPYKIYWGPGLPVYSYELRTSTGRTISVEYIRAKNIRHVLPRIQEYWPSVQGVKTI